MELVKTQVQMEKKKGVVLAQAAFDEAYHLPDYLPDLFSVVLTSPGLFVSGYCTGQIRTSGRSAAWTGKSPSRKRWPWIR